MPQALLIQDVHEYLRILKPAIHAQFRKHEIYVGATEAQALHWIIAHELNLIYGLTVVGYDRYPEPYRTLHNHLNFHLPVSLSVLTRHHIKAPCLYGEDTEVQIKLTQLDLYIRYWSPHTNLFEAYNNFP